MHVWPGFYEGSIYGLAIDLGSTTIAGHLCDLVSGEVLASSGLMNPQIRFGEDLMSRVSYAMMNPGGDAEMTRAVRGAMNELVTQCAAEAGIEPDLIFEAVIVCNPIMHHLLLGIDPVELGQAPFALATAASQTLWATEIDMAMHRDARVYILPCIAGHVGADAAAVALSEAPNQSDDLMLIVDVGTNAEILLGDRTSVLACSSPTGPAFEGAQISSGQRAAPGAIERVEIDPATKEPRFRVIGSDLWSDDPGFDEATEILRHHRHLRLGHHRGHRRDAHGGARRSRRPDRLGRTDRHRPLRPRRPHPRLRPPRRHRRRAAPASSSPRATCAPSSSPNPRSTPARAC